MGQQPLGQQPLGQPNDELMRHVHLQQEQGSGVQPVPGAPQESPELQMTQFIHPFTLLKWLWSLYSKFVMTCFGFLLDRSLHVLTSPLFFSHLPMTIKSPLLPAKSLSYYTESKSWTMVTGNALSFNSIAEDMCCTFITAKKKKKPQCKM